MAKDERWRPVGLAASEIILEALNLVFRHGVSHNDLHHDVDLVRVTHEGLGIVCEDIRRLENTLDRAGLDVELVVAEAVSSKS